MLTTFTYRLEVVKTKMEGADFLIDYEKENNFY